MSGSQTMPFRRFGTMLDCSRNAVMNLPSLKKWVDILADLGYNTLLLYIEDTYEVEGQPYFGYLRGRYSQEELQEIDAYAAGKGIELIPCVQTLAHLNAIFRWPQYRKICDCNDILLAGNDETYGLIEDMFASLSKSFRSRIVNIGMDEAHMLGRGQYLDINGLCDRSGILVQHLARVAKIAEKYGLELIMWGDMFFRMISGGNYYVDDLQVSEEIKKQVPDNVRLIYWDYYSSDKSRYDRQIKAHNAIKEGIWFAGGLWSWTGFAPHNGFSMAATASALASCLENGVQDVFLTMWGDNGAECSKFSLLPSLYYAAEYAKGNTELDGIKAGFEKQFGLPFDTFLLADLSGTVDACATDIYNPSKYLLYNDCFLGCLDSTVRETDAADYAACAKALAVPEKDPAYGYLFSTLRTLCDVLAIKADLGLRTRRAYVAGDKTALTALLPEYTELGERLEVFYEAFQTQWMRENKPHGFDVQDLRLGGAMRRVRHCRERLARYLDGTLERLEELEEPLLHPSGCGTDFAPAPLCTNSWGQNATANCV